MTANAKVNTVSYNIGAKAINGKDEYYIDILLHSNQEMASKTLTFQSGHYDTTEEQKSALRTVLSEFRKFAEYLNNNELIWSDVLTTQELISTRQLCAAVYWDAEYYSMESSSYDDNLFGDKFLILTEEESFEKCKEYAQNYLESEILESIPENLRQYFDEDEFVDDMLEESSAGELLSSYDGNEDDISLSKYFFPSKSTPKLSEYYSDNLKEFFIEQYRLPEDFDFDSDVWNWIVSEFDQNDYDEDIESDFLVYRQG